MDSPADKLRELTKVLERIRLEVTTCDRLLQDLYTYSRTCPQCGRFLERQDRKIALACPCGWMWEPVDER